MIRLNQCSWSSLKGEKRATIEKNDHVLLAFLEADTIGQIRTQLC
jgi:hypothetical protein